MKPFVLFLATFVFFCWLKVPWVTSDAVIPEIVKLGVLVSPEDESYLPIVRQAVDVINQNVTSSGGVDVRLVLSHQVVRSPNAFTLSAQVCSLLSDGAAVLLILSPCQLSPYLHQLPALTGVPVVYLNDGACDVISDDDDDSPPAEASSHDVLMSLADVMIKERWNDTQIFYETEYEPHVLWLVSRLSLHGRQSSIFNAQVRNVRPLLDVRDTFQARDFFLVLASQTTVEWIFSEARVTDLDLLGPKYRWLLGDEGQLDKESLLRLLKEGDNVAIVAQDKTAQDNLHKKVNETLLWLAEGVRRVVAEGVWVDDLRGCDPSGTPRYSQARHSLLQTLQAFKPQLAHPVVEILTLGAGLKGRVGWNLIGSWTASSGNFIDGYLYPDIHRGFNNRTFLITTASYPPFVIRRPNGTYEGICFDILHELQRVLNFSYKVVEPEDGRWGVKLANGNYSGMIGLLQRKRVDFGVGIFGVNAERQEVVDFSTPFMADPTIVLMRKPDLASSQVFICLSPFHYSVWFLIALSVLLVGGVLWALVWYHPTHDHRRKSDLSQVGIYDPHINIWQVFGAFMQQGMVYVPTSHSARVLVAAWWLYVIVVVGTYNGNLIAFLTAPKVYTPVNSLKELADSGMRFGFLLDSNVHGVFKNADSGTYKRLWHTIEAQKERYLVEDNLDGMEKALTDRNYAFLIEKSFFDTLANKEVDFRNNSCQFARAREAFLTSFYAFPFQKHSPYTAIFSKKLLRILEAGLVQRWQRQWYAVVHRCTGLERTTDQTNISLAEAQGAFYLLGLGLLVASLFLFGEKIFCSRRTSSNSSSVPSIGEVGNGHVPMGSVYHVGSLPPVITHVTSHKPEDRQHRRTQELQVQFPVATFSPYAKWKQRKLRKSRSFPLLFKSCFRRPKTREDEPAWELPVQNGTGSRRSQQSVSELFSMSPAVKWHDKYGRKSNGLNGVTNGTLSRRWHSDNGTYLENSYVKDAETGEFQQSKDERRL